jgi:hypothetical protein
VAKHRARTDWQLDLKPVALTNPALTSRKGTTRNNGVRPAAAPGSAEADPAIIKALTDLRASDTAILDVLAGIGATLEQLRISVEGLAARVDAFEAHRETQAAKTPARPARPVKETSRSLRDSSSATFDRRARRGTLRVANDDTPE